jgi:integrase
MRLVRYRGYWAVTGIDNGKQWRRSLRTRDRAAAERAFHDYKRPTPGDTVGAIMEAYLADKKGRRSYGSMVTAWKSLGRTFGHLSPRQIDRDLCRGYRLSRQAAGVADGTVIKDLGVLKAAIRWAGKAEGAKFELPPTPPPRDRYITRQEVQRLVDAAELGHVKLFITLAWCTAGRHSALLELTWDRVDFEKRRVRLATDAQHGRKGRATVYINDWLLPALQAAYEARTSEFVIEWGGSPLKSIKRSFAAAARKAGLADVTPHILRHSSACAMARAGVPIEEIAKYLGHSSTKVTYSTYLKYTPDYLSKAAKALE